MVKCKLVSFATVIALWTLVNLLIKLIRMLLKWKYIHCKNYAILAAMIRKRSYFVKKVSSRSPGLECSYGKIFIPVTEISVAKTEISVTGPARALIWTHRNFFEGKTGEARSRKPSQAGWPGSYEEALSNECGAASQSFTRFALSNFVRHYKWPFIWQPQWSSDSPWKQAPRHTGRSTARKPLVTILTNWKVQCDWNFYLLSLWPQKNVQLSQKATNHSPVNLAWEYIMIRASALISVNKKKN